MKRHGGPGARRPDRAGAAEHLPNSVANIGPGETVLVQIEYQEPVQQNGNEFSLPGADGGGPRYNPAPVVQASTSARRQRLGASKSQAKSRAKPIRSQTAIASRRPCSIRQKNARSIRPALPCACRPASRSARSEPSHAVQTENPDARPASSALPTAWCRRIATSS